MPTAKPAVERLEIVHLPVDQLRPNPWNPNRVRYPILPKITRSRSRQVRREILHIRDSSLYMPRDFDISPYFEIVKPTIELGFDYTSLHWADKPRPLREVAGSIDPFPHADAAPSLVPETTHPASSPEAEEVRDEIAA